MMEIGEDDSNDGDDGDDDDGDDDGDDDDDGGGGVFGESSVHTVGRVWQQFVATAIPPPLHSYT